jgi:hydroxymethylpyrimidine/phosphomethylpyrimidine kinase
MNEQSPPRILVIAGSDSGGGAGIQADIKSITVLGGYAMTAITAITAQNTVGVQRIFPLPLLEVEAQIDSVLSDIGVDVFKTGMLSEPKLMKLIADKVNDHRLVLDPVMVATSGDVLISTETIAELKRTLIPKAFLLTPNIPEAEKLTGITINSLDTQIKAGKKLCALGAKNVLIKGGHHDGIEVLDVLITPTIHRVFRSIRINSNNTHGTGCTLASALATLLGKGLPLEQCVSEAIQYVQKAIRKAPNFGQGHGPLWHRV